MGKRPGEDDAPTGARQEERGVGWNSGRATLKQEGERDLRRAWRVEERVC